METLNLATVIPSEKLSIGEIVAKDFRTAEIFRKYGIDFCCGGKKTIANACKDNPETKEKIFLELKELAQSGKTQIHNFNEWELDFLVDYIVNTHHTYVKSNLPVIMEYTQKITQVHGDVHPELPEINQHFKDVNDELTMHMYKEENILFPYIKTLVEFKKLKSGNIKSPFGTIQNPINMMEHEHDLAGNKMKSIRELSNNYTPAQDACTTFTLAFKKLLEFENDLHQHIHLENNILFPKALQMEKELTDN